MKNRLAFYKAQNIDPSLKGDNWPEGLTVSQVKNLWSQDEKNEIFRLLNAYIENGSLGFDDILASYSWEKGVLSDMLGGSDEEVKTKRHEPDIGWLKFWRGIKPGESKVLSGHACGCDIECTLERVFDNGLPERWKCLGTHRDGLKIEFTCRAIPLISRSIFSEFCDGNKLKITGESLLNNWVIIKNKKLKENPDVLRTKHAKDWVNRKKYKGDLPDITIIEALREERPELWGKGESTFRKWVQIEKESKSLFPNSRRK